MGQRTKQTFLQRRHTDVLFCFHRCFFNLFPTHISTRMQSYGFSDLYLTQKHEQSSSVMLGPSWTTFFWFSLSRPWTRQPAPFSHFCHPLSLPRIILNTRPPCRAQSSVPPQNLPRLPGKLRALPPLNVPLSTLRPARTSLLLPCAFPPPA